jgi:Fe-S cluster assembly iron-binding protein IscA
MNDPKASETSRPVDISFDCMPLRSMARLDPPLDASPALVAKYDRIKEAIAEHGTYNTYFLHNAVCRFFVTNDPAHGMIAFRFEGVVFTDEEDSRARQASLRVTLDKETCPWLEQHVVKWFEETVTQAVVVEFNRFIGAGDAEQTKKRKEQMERALEARGGFVGMHL